MTDDQRAPTSSDRAPRGPYARTFPAEIAFLLASAAIVLFFLVPYLPVPFVTRDEAVYACFADNASTDFILYRDFWDMHSPALYYLYAAAFDLSESRMLAVRIIHIAVQWLAILGYYLLLRRLLRPRLARLGALAYAVYAVSGSFEAHAANVEPFLLAPSFFALALAFAGEKRRLILAGALFGVATLFKQHAPLLMAVPVLVALLDRSRATFLGARIREALRTLAPLLVGWTLPILLTGILFAAFGSLRPMLECTVEFMLFHRLGDASPVARLKDVAFLVSLLYRSHPSLAVVGLAGLSLVSIRAAPMPEGTGNGSQESRRGRETFVMVWLMASLIMVAIAGRPFPQYLQLAAPPMCALGFMALQALLHAPAGIARRLATVVLAGTLLLDGAVAIAATLPQYVGRGTFWREPFDWVEAPVGEYIRERTEPGERIFVWGPYPAVYYFAQRAPHTRHVSLFAVARPNASGSGDLSVPGTMDELKRDFALHPPRYLVVAPKLTSYDLNQEHFAWVRALLEAQYEKEAQIESIAIYRRNGVSVPRDP